MILRRSILSLALALAGAAGTPALALVDFNVFAGTDFAGDFEVDTFDTDARTGYHLGAELIFDPIKKLDLGVGLEYGFPRGADSDSIDDLDYTHLYGIGRLFLLGDLARWYLAARIGYTNMSADEILNSDLDGKETWSVGTGFELLDRLKLELLFNDFSGDVDTAGGGSADFDYQSLSTRIVFTLR